jgi:hypothetical protein
MTCGDPIMRQSISLIAPLNRQETEHCFLAIQSNSLVTLYAFAHLPHDLIGRQIAEPV